MKRPTQLVGLTRDSGRHVDENSIINWESRHSRPLIILPFLLLLGLLNILLCLSPGFAQVPNNMWSIVIVLKVTSLDYLRQSLLSRQHWVLAVQHEKGRLTCRFLFATPVRKKDEGQLLIPVRSSWLASLRALEWACCPPAHQSEDGKQLWILCVYPLASKAHVDQALRELQDRDQIRVLEAPHGNWLSQIQAIMLSLMQTGQGWGKPPPTWLGNQQTWWHIYSLWLT